MPNTVDSQAEEDKGLAASSREPNDVDPYTPQTVSSRSMDGGASHRLIVFTICELLKLGDDGTTKVQYWVINDMQDEIPIQQVSIPTATQQKHWNFPTDKMLKGLHPGERFEYVVGKNEWIQMGSKGKRQRAEGTGDTSTGLDNADPLHLQPDGGTEPPVPPGYTRVRKTTATGFADGADYKDGLNGRFKTATGLVRKMIMLKDVVLNGLGGFCPEEGQTIQVIEPKPDGELVQLIRPYAVEKHKPTGMKSKTENRKPEQWALVNRNVQGGTQLQWLNWNMVDPVVSKSLPKVDISSSEWKSQVKDNNAVVRRAGERLVIPTVEVVLGDIVLLKRGDSVPADLRLVEAHQLGLQQHLVTELWEVIFKHTDVVPQSTPVAEQNN
eukprot:g30358.t1